MRLIYEVIRQKKLICICYRLSLRQILCKIPCAGEKHKKRVGIYWLLISQICQTFTAWKLATKWRRNPFSCIFLHVLSYFTRVFLAFYIVLSLFPYWQFSLFLQVFLPVSYFDRGNREKPKGNTKGLSGIFQSNLNKTARGNFEIFKITHLQTKSMQII